MADLDVSDLLLDPDFTEVFKVLRQREVVGTNGRSTATVSALPGIVGVITMASPNDLLRVPDEQHSDKNISVVTKFRLRGPSPGYQPDKIVWQGDTYIVHNVEPYTQFGSGFVQAIAGSIDAIDQPPAEEEL